MNRLSIKSCAGTKGVRGSSHVKWYRPVNDAIPGLVYCEACFEDFVFVSNFENYFAPNEEQHPDGT